MKIYIDHYDLNRVYKTEKGYKGVQANQGDRITAKTVRLNSDYC